MHHKFAIKLGRVFNDNIKLQSKSTIIADKSEIMAAIACVEDVNSTQTKCIYIGQGFNIAS